MTDIEYGILEKLDTWEQVLCRDRLQFELRLEFGDELPNIAFIENGIKGNINVECNNPCTWNGWFNIEYTVISSRFQFEYNTPHGEVIIEFEPACAEIRRIVNEVSKEFPEFFV